VRHRSSLVGLVRSARRSGSIWASVWNTHRASREWDICTWSRWSGDGRKRQICRTIRQCSFGIEFGLLGRSHSLALSMYYHVDPVHCLRSSEDRSSLSLHPWLRTDMQLKIIIVRRGRQTDRWLRMDTGSSSQPSSFVSYSQSAGLDRARRQGQQRLGVRLQAGYLHGLYVLMQIALYLARLVGTGYCQRIGYGGLPEVQW
jgi:hypothetical protein